LLATSIAAFQLVLDRGQQKDWFDSTEICLEAITAATALYMFVVHVTTTEQPFVRLAIFRNRNFSLSIVILFALGLMMFSILSLIPPMLSNLMGYSTLQVGIATAPRGLGVLVAMLLVGRIYDRVDARLLILAGMGFSVLSSFQLSEMSLTADSGLIFASGWFNGFGSSMLAVPVSAMAFSTLEAKYRGEAAAMSVLIRNMGSSTGIALLQALTIRNTSIVQSRLVEGITVDSQVMHLRMPDLDFGSAESLARLNGEIVRQASMIAYIDSFWFLGWIGLVATPLALLLRLPNYRAIKGAR
jgi:DHA2 family multidrug resistance protein